MSEEDAPELGTVFADQLREFLKTRSVGSMRRLSERCAEMGATDLTEASLVNLTRRTNRRRITVEDWLTIAAALEVPPLSLILPAGKTNQVRLLPGEPASVGDVLAWLRAEHEPAVPETGAGGVRHAGAHPAWSPRPMDLEALATLDLIASHARLARQIDWWADRPSMNIHVRSAARALAAAREEISKRREALPDVSPTVAAVLANPPKVWAGEMGGEDDG